MNKVYVTTHATRKNADGVHRPIDITPAACFGELIELLPPGMMSLTPMPTVRELKYGLRNFSDDDYLLPLGDPALIAAAGAAAAYANSGRFKVLRWDRQSGNYIPIQIDLNTRKDKEQ
jgi:hypothetical protein